MKFVFHMIENIVGKGENAGYQQKMQISYSCFSKNGDCGGISVSQTHLVDQGVDLSWYTCSTQVTCNDIVNLLTALFCWDQTCMGCSGKRCSVLLQK